MTTLLAFDPGGRTGWFMASYDRGGSIDTRSIQWGQMGPEHHHSGLLRFMDSALDSNPHLVIVAENYKPEFARPQNFVALEYLGIMEAFARSHLVSFERQDRGLKTTWTSEKLRTLNMWPKGMPHAQDAARHWLAYATKTNRALEVKTQMMLRD